MLKIKNLDVYYDQAQALFNISIEVKQGEIVAIIGANGAGKSTLLKVICGLIRIKSGEIIFNEEKITNFPPHKIVELGITMVPEGRHIFPDLTVEENLVMGAYTRNISKRELSGELEKIYILFPVLPKRRKQLAGTLSGGEQQMLAIGRGLMAKPKIFLLDEPSMGLAPILVSEVAGIITRIYKELGITIVLVEQNANVALEISKRAYVLEVGHKTIEGYSKDIKEDKRVIKAYLGGSQREVVEGLC